LREPFDTIREAVIDRAAGLPLKGEPLLKRQLNCFQSEANTVEFANQRSRGGLRTMW
jgi:hypothetical protein